MPRRSRGASADPAGAAAGHGEPGDALPPEFRERLTRLLGEESEAFFAALLDPPPGLRVNTLRVSTDRFREISPFPLEPLEYPPAGFRLPSDVRPGRHPFHAAGLFYLQDPGAMAVAAMLAPRPGERVIDLAAAPGGKTTHLAALMRGAGILIANDVQPARTRELIGNLERCGVRDAVVTLESVERLAARFGAWFDRVLLDAPCSGEAMFHKSAAARADWSPASVAGCARRQLDLLHDAARLVRPGGTLVYSTCTFSPDEDEEVVARFLHAHPVFQLVELAPIPGAQPGRPDWLPPELGDASLARAVRLWPHRVPGAGHFVAGLRRTDGAESTPAPSAPGQPPGDARALWDAFCRENLQHDPSGGGVLEMRGQELYCLPQGLPDTSGLRVERPGWWLGTVQKNRFEPAHALAAALPPTAARDTLRLDPDDPAVLAYLRGETITAAGDRGWVVVTVEDFALGWGKRVGSVVKNHFPKGLRWRA